MTAKPPLAAAPRKASADSEVGGDRNLQSAEVWGQTDGARDEQGCFLLAGTFLSLNLQRRPRVLINNRETRFLRGAGACGVHQRHAGLAGGAGSRADRSA